jgi:hypothetical protein
MIIRRWSKLRAALHPVFVLAWPVVSSFARGALQGSADADDAAQLDC